MKITYVTGLDGWGDVGLSEEDRETYCALIEERLQALYPAHTIEASVDTRALESRVETDDYDVDARDVLYAADKAFNDWCGGERAGQDA